MVKQQSDTVTQNRIPPFKTEAGDLVVMNQAKADLLATHFKIATKEPERQFPHLTSL